MNEVSDIRLNQGLRWKGMKSIPAICLFSILCSLAYSAHAADVVPTASAPTTDPALAGDGVQVGIARRDGITFSGGEIFVTRNGATEKLTKELQLPSGIIANPDGTIMLPDKSQATLRSTQILTFEGKIMELPIDPNVNPAPPTSVARSAVAGAAISAAPGNSSQQPMAGASARSMAMPGGASSVFLGADGQPFMGTLNPNGTILTSDGRTMAIDRTMRAVTFSNDGTPALGTINANGTVTRPDGASIFPDGSVRGANGNLMTPARAMNSGNNQNGSRNNNPAVNGQNANQAGQNNQATGQTNAGNTTAGQNPNATNPTAGQNPNAGNQAPGQNPNTNQGNAGTGAGRAGANGGATGGAAGGAAGGNESSGGRGTGGATGGAGGGSGTGGSK